MQAFAGFYTLAPMPNKYKNIPANNAVRCRAGSLVYTASIPCLFAMVEGYLPILLQNQSFSSAQIGSLGSIWNLLGILAMFLAGRLLDRYPYYRPMLTFTLLGTALGIYLLSQSRSFWPGALAISVFAVSYQAFYTTFESSIVFQHAANKRNYGIARSFCSVGYAGFTAFLGLSGLLAFPDTKRLLVFFALLLAVALVSVLLFFGRRPPALPGSLGLSRAAHSKAQNMAVPAAPSQSKPPPIPCQRPQIQQLETKMQWLLLAIGLAWGLLLGIRTIFFPIYVRDVVQSEDIGLMLSVATVSEIPVLFFAAKILHRRSLGLMLLLGFGAALLRLLLEALLPYFTAILLLQMLHSLAFALFFAAAIAIINQYFAPKKAWATALLICLRPLSIALLGAPAGRLVEIAGYRVLFLLYCAVAALVFIPCYKMRWNLLAL